MVLIILPQHLDSYTLWLQNHQYQSNTVRNYQQDLKTYLSFSKNEVSENSISKYFEVFSSKTNSSRYLASLSTFCQFLLDQHLTEVNLFRQTKKHLRRQPSLDLEKLLMQYQNFLIKDHKSDLTIKNYLNDIHQYFDWLQSNPSQSKPTPSPSLDEMRGKKQKLKINFLQSLPFIKGRWSGSSRTEGVSTIEPQK